MSLLARLAATPRALLRGAVAGVQTYARATRRVGELQRRGRGALAKLGYDGADRGRLLQAFMAGSRSATSELLADLGLLRDRARALVRNNGWAKGIIRGLTTHVFGTGFQPAFGDGDPREEVWRQWAEAPICDHEGKRTLRALLGEVVFNRFLSGEILLVRRRLAAPIRWRGHKLPPLQIQVLEADYIDDRKNEPSMDGGGRIVQGIEQDREGRVVAYWLYENHPGDPTTFNWVSRRVPASEVIHYYRRERAQQLRGEPQLAPAIAILWELQEATRNHLIRQKIAAAWAVFRRVANADLLDPADAAARGEVIDSAVQEVIPGALLTLVNGEDVSAPNPPEVGDFAPYTKLILLAIAKACDVPYELATGDFPSSFSASRLAFLGFHGSVDQEQALVFEPLVLDWLWYWFEEAAQLAGIPGFAMPADVPEWVAPAKPMIDALSVTKDEIDAVRAGFTSQQRVIRRRGMQPRDVLREQKEWTAAADKAGLALDTDGRKFARAASAPLPPDQFDPDKQTPVADAPASPQE